MLEYNQITQRKYIVVDGEPYEVIDSHVFRKQQRKPVNQTKIKNLISGKVIERSFHQSEKAEVADISTKKIKYLYTNRGGVWFCEENDASKRFPLPEEGLIDKLKYMKQNDLVDALVFDNKNEERIIGIKLPSKVELLVTEAPPGIKGNTAQGGTKLVVTETGASFNVPLFIDKGDIVRINTDTGEYVERVRK